MTKMEAWRNNRTLVIGVGALVALSLFVIGGIAFDGGDDPQTNSKPIVWNERDRNEFLRDCATGYADYINTGQVTHTNAECRCWLDHVEGHYSSYRVYGYAWNEQTGRLPRTCS